jgi:hypothetical protein
MTPKQIQAARTNGSSSKGPITPQGKQSSARNSTRHGLLAQTVVLEEESTERFLDLLVAYMDEYQPATASQVSLVETMAVARWRQLRVWGAEKPAIDRDPTTTHPSPTAQRRQPDKPGKKKTSPLRNEPQKQLKAKWGGPPGPRGSSRTRSGSPGDRIQNDARRPT